MKPGDMKATDEIRIERGSDHALLLVSGERKTRVTARRCFPWRQQDRFISLADKDGKEQTLIHDLRELDSASREALEEALVVTGFTLTIDRILSVKKEIEIRNWRVEVAGRKRTFQTELDEWPRVLTDGSLLIRDVAGDLYSIPDPPQLDEASRRSLWSLT